MKVLTAGANVSPHLCLTLANESMAKKIVNVNAESTHVSLSVESVENKIGVPAGEGLEHPFVPVRAPPRRVVNGVVPSVSAVDVTTREECNARVNKTPTDVVQMRNPLADGEATNERCDGKWATTRTRVGHGEVCDNIVVKNVFGEGSTWVPLDGVRRYVSFFVVFEFGITYLTSQIVTRLASNHSQMSRIFQAGVDEEDGCCYLVVQI